MPMSDQFRTQADGSRPVGTYRPLSGRATSYGGAYSPIRIQTARDPSTLGNTTPQTGGPVTIDATGPPGAQTLGMPQSGGSKFGTGDSAEFLSALYQSRPAFVGQQGDLLSRFGPSIRNSIFAASPELAQAGQHIQDTFQDPFGGALGTFQDAMRSAQSARGFGGGGSGVAGEEARYLTNYAMQRQDKMLPEAMRYGQQMLDIAGLGKPPSPGLGEIGSLAMQSRTLQEQTAAGKAQSATAAQMYEDYMRSLQPQQTPNPYGQGGGTTSVIVGGGLAGGGTQGGAGQFSGVNPGTQGGAGQFTAKNNPYYTW